MINRSRHVRSITATVSTVAMTLVTFGFDATTDVAVADRVIVSVVTNAVRVTWDDALGNAPTTSAGVRIPLNDFPPYVIEGRQNAANFQIIRDAAADASVTIVIESD